MGGIIGSVASSVLSPILGGAVSSVFAPSPSSVAAPSTVSGTAAAASDPFAAQRDQYQTQLQQMMTPGAAFNAQDPSYAWRFNQGLSAVQRTDAASGRTASGAALLEAANYGQNMASTEYGNQFNRLSHLAGADVGSPAAAGQILAGAGQQQQAGATAFGNQMGGAISGGISNWFQNQQTPAQTMTPAPSAGWAGPVGSNPSVWAG